MAKGATMGSAKDAASRAGRDAGAAGRFGGDGAAECGGTDIDGRPAARDPAAVDDAAAAATPLAGERATDRTALLVIDMFSGWDFDDAERLVGGAAHIAPAIAELAARCRRCGVPVIYANDNHGRWRSDLRHVIAAAMEGDGRGAAIARRLAPHDDDYIVLKPKHSAFHATPLDLLLRHLDAKRLILCGVATDQCVLYTAADAKMLDYDVVVAADCVATQSTERNAWALRHFAEAMRIDTPASSALTLPAQGAAGGAGGRAAGEPTRHDTSDASETPGGDAAAANDAAVAATDAAAG